MPFPSMPLAHSGINRVRRRLLQAAGLSFAVFATAKARALAGGAQSLQSSKRSRLILLGTAGGPTPKADRSAPANAIVIDGAIYVV
ncbi:MAG: hypothetical protein M3R20_01325, partial [Pseudomonadota bacterium]|nr:hypothetical protein [Pseudomonadota bacterium]